MFAEKTGELCLNGLGGGGGRKIEGAFSAEDLKDLNVNQLLRHLFSTKNKEASNEIQQCILEGMHMSAIRDRIKSYEELQKVSKENKITYARTRRSQLISFYRMVEKFSPLKNLDSGFKPSEILNKLSVNEAVCETNPEFWADGATSIDSNSDEESSSCKDDDQ